MNSKQIFKYKLLIATVSIVLLVAGAWLQILTVKEAWNELIVPLTGLAPIGFTKALVAEIGVGVVSGRYWSKAERLAAQNKSRDTALDQGAYVVLAAVITYGLVNLISYLFV